MKIKSIALTLLGTAALTACMPTSEKTTTAPQETPFNNIVDSLSYVLGMGYSASIEDLQMVLDNSGSDSAFVNQLIQGVQDGVRGGDKEKLAYFIGLRSGMNMRTEIIEEAESQLYGEDTTKHLNIENFITGFLDVTKNKFNFKVNGEVMYPAQAGNYVRGILNMKFIELQKGTYPKEYKENNEYILKKAQESGIDSLPSGILYKVITPGKGPKPSKGNIITIDYEGRLIDGTVITKSFSTTDVAVSKGIIDFPGFEMMVTNMPLGAEWEAYIPWKYCYGAHGNSDLIPPFSNIIFKVKLHNIK